MPPEATATKIGVSVLWVLALAALVLPAAACGSSQGRDRVPVFPTKGSVKLEGTSPKGALIVLHPKNGKHASDGNTIRPYATIHDDGTFELTSLRNQ